MKIISKMLVGALAFAVTNVYAAELMTKAEFEKVESQYEKIGDISTFSRQIYTVFVYFYKCPKTKFLCCTLKELTKISSWV